MSPTSSPFVMNATASRARLAHFELLKPQAADRYVVTYDRDNLPGTCKLPDRILRRGIEILGDVLRNVGERECGPASMR